VNENQPHAVTYRVLFHVGATVTNVRVVKAIDQRGERVLLRQSAIRLPLSRSQTQSASDDAVVECLVALLAHRLTAEARGRSAPPTGATGGRGWSQPELPK
jgi:hypothetical protein